MKKIILSILLIAVIGFLFCGFIHGVDWLLKYVNGYKERPAAAKVDRTEPPPGYGIATDGNGHYAVVEKDGDKPWVNDGTVWKSRQEVISFEWMIVQDEAKRSVADAAKPHYHFYISQNPTPQPPRTYPTNVAVTVSATNIAMIFYQYSNR